MEGQRRNCAEQPRAPAVAAVAALKDRGRRQMEAQVDMALAETWREAFQVEGTSVLPVVVGGAGEAVVSLGSLEE